MAGTALPLDERLARYIVEGSRDGLVEDLETKRGETAPLDIINGPLMKGMEEVGRLFNDNQLIVAEVLQSAEAMKAAVGHLEQFMERTESATRGSIVLATVKGDVHDIGKNLVEIIWKNNGYRIINLGIKVPPEDLIAAYHAHKPDAFGLSGLLVKSAQQMVLTAQDLRAAGIDIPLFVGGAALTRKFTATRIAPEYPGATIYAKDAMDGLDLANRLFGATTREALARRHRRAAGGAPGGGRGARLRGRTRRAAARPIGGVSHRSRCRVPPDLDLHVLRDVPLTHVYPYLNLQMLLGKHLGLKGSVARLLEEGDLKTVELRAMVQALQDEAAARGLIRADGLYRFYEANAAGNRLLLYEGGREVARFDFPRQRAGERLCLADYVRDVDRGERDHVAIFAVTCGAGIRAQAEQWKNDGQYLRSHALQALAIECAEAFAEMLHARLRTQWGFPDPPDLTMAERLKARYQGLRVSPGYPACPELADQRTIFSLLGPERIGLDSHRGLHDGSRGLRVGARLPPSRGEVLQGRRGRRVGLMLATAVEGVSPRFLSLLSQEDLAARRVLDVGCGAGRVALALAPACSLGGRARPGRRPDRGGSPARGARPGSPTPSSTSPTWKRRSIASWGPGLVTAHLCASDAIIERAGRALPAGGCLAMVAFHVDQWRETGKVVSLRL